MLSAEPSNTVMQMSSNGAHVFTLGVSAAAWFPMALSLRTALEAESGEPGWASAHRDVEDIVATAIGQDLQQANFQHKRWRYTNLEPLQG